MIGQQISHYKIIRKLGEGGMGEVYLAVDTQLQRPVALKFYKPAAANRPDLIQRFKQEALVAASLNHPNIVTIYEVFEHRDHHVIAMEYVNGRCLNDLYGSAKTPGSQDDFSPDQVAPLPLETFFAIGKQIIAGVAAAHQGGVIHRDLKPENILITENGQVKILDFGLAKYREGGNLTKSTDRFGTPNYMAPEQIVGQDVDHRSDIFSLGVIFYEMLSGRRPFGRANDMAVLYAILNEEPTPLIKLRPDAPQPVIAIIEKCLQKNPDERPEKMEEIQQEFSRTLHPSQVDIHTVAAPPQRRVFKFWLPISIFLLMAVWYFGRQYLPRWSTPVVQDAAPPAVAVFPFVLEGNADYQYLSEGIARLLASKLDGAGDLRTLDSRAVFNLADRQNRTLNDVVAASAAARKFEARYLIQGNILMVGEQLSVEARLYQIEKKTLLISNTTLTCPINEVLGHVDRLATDLLTGLASISKSGLQLSTTVTTHSLPALKAFLVGESKFRSGDYQGALAAFQQGVAIDTSFALAYYRLSLAADWLTRPDIANQAAQKAVRHSHRLSERDRSLLKALQTWQSGNAVLAEQQYRAIVGTNREDLEAWFQLGEVLFHYGPLHGRSISAAREAFETAIALEPDHIPSLWHLARIAAWEGKKVELKTIANHIHQIQPGGERELELAALKAFALDDPDAQKAVIRDLRRQSDVTVALAVWNVASYCPKFWHAESLAGILTEPNRSAEAKALGYVMMAHLSFARGKWHAATAFLDKARSFDPAAATRSQGLMVSLNFLPGGAAQKNQLIQQLLRLDQTGFRDNVTPSIFFTVHNEVQKTINRYLLALLQLQMGDQKAVNQAKNDWQKFYKKPEQHSLAGDLALDLEAQQAIQHHSPEKALRIYEGLNRQTWYGLAVTSPFFSRALLRYHHAELLFSQKNYHQALANYRTFGEYSIYDLIYRAPAAFRMGEIYLQMNRPDSAAIQFREFLTLWEECDPEFQPKVVEAQSYLTQQKATTPAR